MHAVLWAVCARLCRFWRNGVDQGLAFTDLGRPLLAAVCLGSQAGGIPSAVRIVSPGVRSFHALPLGSPLELDVFRSTLQRTLPAPGAVVAPYAFGLGLHPGVQHEGTLLFALRIDEAADPSNVAVGVFDANRFDPVVDTFGAIACVAACMLMSVALIWCVCLCMCPFDSRWPWLLGAVWSRRAT
jgi:hypothetical protein